MAKKITFTLAAHIADGAVSGLLLGDFNNWDVDNATVLKKQKDGSFKAVLSLEEGKTYQYRYFLNDGRWVNDDNAAQYEAVAGYDVHNCVIAVPFDIKPIAKPKKTAVKEASIEVEAKPAKKAAAKKVVISEDKVTSKPVKKAATKKKAE